MANFRAESGLYIFNSLTILNIYFQAKSDRLLEKVGHEWTLVCLAWNLKRMALLRPKRVK